MNDVLRFFAGVLGSTLDPLVLAGAIASGFFRRWWLAIGAAAGWAIASDVAAQLISPRGYHGQVIAHRMVGAVIVAAAVWGIAELVRRHRRKPPQ